jgi:microcystin degradation protein MlrC
VEPTHYRMVQVKSSIGFRASYEPLADQIVLLESPGYTTSDFASLPWRAIPRPLFPLDDIPDEVATAFQHGVALRA